MNKLEKMQEIILALNKYRDVYYNNSESLISDYEYDKMFDELQQLEKDAGVVMSNSPTQTVGYEVKSKLEKVKHSHPMLSLDKTKSVDELKKFIGDQAAILSLKMDGLTVLLTYENGELVQAETRGNGEEGELITHNAKVFENIPLRIDYKGHFEIEGEAIITYQDFEKINEKLSEDEKYKNPRNLVSGSVRQLDSTVAAQRHIRFVAWKVPGLQDESFRREYDTMYLRLMCAASLGFEIVPFLSVTGDMDIEAKVQQLKEGAKVFGYPIDGLVCSYNDIHYGESLGMTGHHPKHSLAFKFYDEEAETILVDIEWTMGKSGVLTPTAVFEPVELEGTTVERSSLHNVSVMYELYPRTWHSGLSLTVYKANQIIPQVSKVEFKESPCAKRLDPPLICPICHGKTEIKQENESKVLICTNPVCEGKLLGKLVHFCSKNAVNIEGMSEATLQFLINKGWVRKFKDLYNLSDEQIKEWKKTPGFGEKSVNKLLGEVEKSRKISLDRFIYSLSIPLIGKSASKTIAKKFNNNVWSFYEAWLDYYDFTQLEDFGQAMHDSMHKYLDDNVWDIRLLMEEFEFEKPIENSSELPLKDKVFVITGSLINFGNRTELQNLIESMGGKVTGSVSAKTNFLINNDKQSSSSKNQKAQKLNIPIISEEDFIKMIGE